MTLEEWLILAKSCPSNSQKAHAPLSPIKMSDRTLHSNSYQLAAVLILICGTSWNQARIPLIRRSSKHRVHADQWAFPGGKWEPSDLNFYHTAARECYEEVGLIPSHTGIPLASVAIPVSSMRVSPFVSILSTQSHVYKCSEEVDALTELPLQLLDNLNIEYQLIGETSVPGFFVNGQFVWGASAMILNQLKEINAWVKNRYEI